MIVVLIKAGQLILSLSILVLLHEFGHFITARMFKTRVEKFYLFFNPWFSLFKYTKGDTEYGLGWLPLGGYVKIAGMIDESMDKEALKQPPQPWEFRSKPAWQRLIIMLGGIIMNVLLGITIYWMLLFAYGEQYIPTANLKYGIAVDSVAESVGFKSGDKILAINGKPVENFNKVMKSMIIDMASTVSIDRNGTPTNVLISDKNIKTIIDNKGAAGFIAPRFPFIIDEVSPGAAKDAGLKHNDVIVAINEEGGMFFDEVRKLLYKNKGTEASITVLRDHKLVSQKVMVPSDGIIGVKVISPDNFFKTEKITYTFFSALPAGISKAWETLVDYIKQFALIFSPTVQGYRHVGSFLTIGDQFSANWDWGVFWSFTGFLSIALAFMNLLPIPALDGGHVMFTLYEMISRRKPGEKFLEYAQMVGMVILLFIMAFALGNDIIQRVL